MKHVVMFSSGIASWMAARRVADDCGTRGLVLLFADTKVEHPDNYRFLEDAAYDVGGELVRLQDGRDIWQVFRDRRFLGNSRVAPCSAELKQRICDRWIIEHCDPADTVRYLGFDWNERHRLDRLRRALPAWRIEAPLCEPPYYTKADMLAKARARGLEPPALYGLGFPHANCGGACVRAGVAHFAHVLKVLPDTYAEWERNEQGIRDYLQADVSILRDRSGGELRPLTLAALRERLAAQNAGQLDFDDWGGCGCFTEEAD